MCLVLCRFRKYVDLYAKDEEAFFKVRTHVRCP